MLRLAASRGGGPNTLGHRPEPEVLPWRLKSAAPGPCQQKRAARLQSMKGGGVQSLKCLAETSREAPKCCAWQHRGGAPNAGTVQSLKCCPCQQKRAARLKSGVFGSIKGGGPETRSGTVQSLKCCPCQQKRAARLKSAEGAAPKRARAPSRA